MDLDHPRLGRTRYPRGAIANLWNRDLRLAPTLDIARADSSQYAVSARGFSDLLANKMLDGAGAADGSFKLYAYCFVFNAILAVIAFTAFELLVSFLQAYVFTLLAGVYIGQAISHEH